jgi:hypothetical protein
VLRSEALRQANVRRASRELFYRYDEEGMLVVSARPSSEDGAR